MNNYIFFNPEKNTDFIKDFLLHLKSKGTKTKVISFEKHLFPVSEYNTTIWPSFFNTKNKLFLFNKIAWTFYLIKFLRYKKQNYNKIVFFNEINLLKIFLPAYTFDKIILIKSPFTKLNNSLWAKIARKVIQKKLHVISIGDNLVNGPENIKYSILSPGIKTKGFEHQENIFSDLAKHNTPREKNNFFTIGAIIDSNNEHNLEILFHAAHELLRHINNLQIIIIGDNEKRKQLIWQCKKLKIDSFTWFVGKQKYLGKWLNSFSVYLNLYEKNNLSDIIYTLQAMAYGSPVIACENSGLDNYISNNKNGFLLNKASSEELLQTIIKLQKNKRLLADMGMQCKHLIDNNYNLDKMVNQFINITSD